MWLVATLLDRGPGSNLAHENLFKPQHRWITALIKTSLSSRPWEQRRPHDAEESFLFLSRPHSWPMAKCIFDIFFFFLYSPVPHLQLSSWGASHNWATCSPKPPHQYLPALLQQCHAPQPPAFPLPTKFPLAQCQDLNQVSRGKQLVQTNRHSNQLLLFLTSSLLLLLNPKL